MRNRLAIKGYVTTIGLDQANNHIKRRRLAGTIRAEQADDLTPVDSN
jgi:hypothetical protein